MSFVNFKTVAIALFVVLGASCERNTTIENNALPSVTELSQNKKFQDWATLENESKSKFVLFNSELSKDKKEGIFQELQVLVTKETLSETEQIQLASALGYSSIAEYNELNLKKVAKYNELLSYYPTLKSETGKALISKAYTQYLPNMKWVLKATDNGLSILNRSTIVGIRCNDDICPCKSMCDEYLRNDDQAAADRANEREQNAINNGINPHDPGDLGGAIFNAGNMAQLWSDLNQNQSENEDCHAGCDEVGACN